MKMCTEMQAVYDTGYRVIASAEYFVKPPRKATASFKALCAEDRLGFVETPCRKGRKLGKRKAHIFRFGVGKLGFSGSGNTLRKQLLGIPTVKAHQVGDEEFSVVFPVSALALVASIVSPCIRKGGPKSRGSDGFLGSRSVEQGSDHTDLPGGL